MKTHMSNPVTFDPHEDGFYIPVCSCAWSEGAYPDLEDAVDALMYHAAQAALATRGETP